MQLNRKLLCYYLGKDLGVWAEHRGFMIGKASVDRQGSSDSITYGEMQHGRVQLWHGVSWVRGSYHALRRVH